MNSLEARGKGQYTCSEGRNCTKGGVQANGEMVVFERNSAFRYVPPIQAVVQDLNHFVIFQLVWYIEKRKARC